MIELSQLFQDVEAAVVQQEPAIVNIEQGAEQTHEHVGKANVQLDTAIVHARSRNKKKWICLGICRKSKLAIRILYLFLPLFPLFLRNPFTKVPLLIASSSRSPSPRLALILL